MLKTLLGGAKTTIKKYFLFFEIFPKNMVFWASKSIPSVRPSVRPSIQVGSRLGPRRAGKLRLHMEGLSHLKENRINLKKKLTTFRGFGTERARLSTFRGFGTERARLGTENSITLQLLFRMVFKR